MRGAEVSAWRLRARAAIMEAHQALPEDCSARARRKAIDAAYPFGAREQWPYKMWLIERKIYLIRHGAARKSKHDRNGQMGLLEEAPK